jgi:hypothetical protein
MQKMGMVHITQRKMACMARAEGGRYYDMSGGLMNMDMGINAYGMYTWT